MPGIGPRRPPSNPSDKAFAAQLLLQYLGFEDTPARREYVLLAQLGHETRQYRVWIDHAAFAKRNALRQDGPDICYQKLRRELAESLGDTDCIGVTEGDLASYREAHTPKGRL
jgi:hypothetical protein